MTKRKFELFIQPYSLCRTMSCDSQIDQNLYLRDVTYERSLTFSVCPEVIFPCLGNWEKLWNVSTKSWVDGALERGHRLVFSHLPHGTLPAKQAKPHSNTSLTRIMAILKYFYMHVNPLSKTLTLNLLFYYPPSSGISSCVRTVCLVHSCQCPWHCH